MKRIKPRLSFTMFGLVSGLIGTYIGIFLSPAVDWSPFNIGMVTAIWCAIGSGVVASVLKSNDHES